VSGVRSSSGESWRLLNTKDQHSQINQPCHRNARPASTIMTPQVTGERGGPSSAKRMCPPSAGWLNQIEPRDQSPAHAAMAT
jgi:hypothetical protein